jgi:hypothetical protein
MLFPESLSQNRSKILSPNPAARPTGSEYQKRRVDPAEPLLQTRQRHTVRAINRPLGPPRKRMTQRRPRRIGLVGRQLATMPQ